MLRIPEVVEENGKRYRIRRTQPYVFPGTVDLPISSAALDVPADAFNNVLSEPVLIGKIRFSAVALTAANAELVTPSQDDLLRFLSIEFKIGMTDEQLSKTRVRLSTLITDDIPYWDISETPLYIPARSTFNARVTNLATAALTGFGAPYDKTRLNVTLDGVRLWLQEA